MEAVGFSESAPPLYYALAWAWTQLTGTGEFGLRSLSALAGVATVPVAYLLGAELRGRRAGIARRGAGRGQPDAALVLAGGARLRAAGPLLTARRAALLRAARLRLAARRRGLDALGRRSRRSPSRPTTSRSSRSRSRRSGCCGAAAARRWPASGSSPSPALAAGAAGDPPDVARPRRVDRRTQPRAPALGGRRHLRRRRDRRHHRPARDACCRRSCRCWRCSPALLLLAARGERGERRAAGRMLAIAAATVAAPLALALLAPGKDYVLARNLLPALVPLLVAVAIGVTAARRPPRRHRVARRAGRLLARLLRSGPASRRPCSAPTGTPSRRGWASRRRRGRSSPGRSARPRCATTSRPAPSRSSPSDGFAWNVHEVDFVSDGPAPPVPARLLGPALPPGRLRTGRPPLREALRAARPRPRATCACGRCATPTSASAPTGSSWTGLDLSCDTGIRLELS